MNIARPMHFKTEDWLLSLITWTLPIGTTDHVTFQTAVCYIVPYIKT